MIEITSLMDDVDSINISLVSQHGLSIFIEYDGRSILFDTGQSDQTWKNAEKLNIDLHDLSAIILSHGHFDHTMGLRSLAQEYTKTDLYVGNDFFEPKYERSAASLTYLGPCISPGYLESQGFRLFEINKDLEIIPGVFIVKNFTQKHPLVISENSVREHNGKIIQDDFHEELVLVLKAKEGLVVLVGCSHPGIKNIVETIKTRFSEPIHAIFGGAHLFESNKQYVRETINFLAIAGISILGLSHCSGELPLHDNIHSFVTGSKYRFEI